MAFKFDKYRLRKCSLLVRMFRDKCICQLCLNEHPLKDCQAHHIIPKVLRPDIAYELDNLITLCKRCHKRVTHSDHRNVRRFRLLWWPYMNRNVNIAFNKKYQERLDKNYNEEDGNISDE